MIMTMTIIIIIIIIIIITITIYQFFEEGKPHHPRVLFLTTLIKRRGKIKEPKTYRDVYD